MLQKLSRRSVLLFLAVTFLTACRGPVPQRPIRLGFKRNTGYQHFFIAQEKNFFRARGVVVDGVPFESTNQMMQAVVTGDIDGTSAGSMEAIGLIEQTSPGLMKVVLTLVYDADSPFHSLLVPVNSPIHSLADLKGKRIATMPGSTSPSWLKLILNHFFDAQRDLTIRQLEPRLQIPALQTNQVDALYTVDPTVTLAVTRGVARVLAKGPENTYILPVIPAGGAVVSTRLIRSRPETVRSLIAALDDAVDFERKNPAASRTIIAKAIKLDPTTAANIDLTRYWKLSETDFAAVQKYLDLLQSQGILAKRIDAKELYLPVDAIPARADDRGH